MNSLHWTRLHPCLLLLSIVWCANKIPVENSIIRYSYPVEVHKVTTTDGYILSLVRIPKDGRQPILLVHGLMCSSAEWTVLGNQSLPLRLSEANYDVWLANARGNTFSRRHSKISASSKKFWTFSWHEIGMYDLPAVIDRILEVTGFPSVHYVGHSQGCTAFCVMSSSLPEYDRKIKTGHLMAPAVMMYHTYSPPIRVLIPRVKELKMLAGFLGIWELLSRSDDSFIGATMTAIQESTPPETFLSIANAISGMRPAQLSQSLTKRIMETMPAGSALMQFEHYGQVIASGRFQQFDYGAAENWLRYNATKPPSYKLEKIRAPLALYYSDNDWLVALKDIQQLKNRLKNVIFDYHVEGPQFNHIDFMFDKEASKIYDEIIRIVKESDSG
ncbi:lipase 3-like [Topomyia yanbarensis]|uniref:lipase 3-like n=1 Tax=Topomyia yanbarensis TaxID=2498891 RepID=UPI00273AC8D2|nr:lipase 3-like [Topomyia yanbarensis]